MFQIIEVLSKLLYMPVKFSGKIEGMLNNIAELSDPIDIPPELIMKGSLEDSHTNYKGKIFKFEEYGNILQSMPISTIFFILLEILSLSLRCCYKKEPSSTKTKKALNIVTSVQLFFLEAQVIDFWFTCLLNITIYPS
jgi:hypothetical protein